MTAFNGYSSLFGHGISAESIIYSSVLAFSTQATANFYADAVPLIKNGLMQMVATSRPIEYLPGEMRSYPKRSTARAILRHAGKWVGDDLPECLGEVYTYRGETRF